MKALFKNVYVLTPYKHATGGIELAHQLVDYINTKGGNAFTVYEKDDRIVSTTSVTPQYNNYNIRISTNIEDSSDNILIVPEGYFDWISRYTHIKVGCWWMSVDFHFCSCHWSDMFIYNSGLRQWLNTFKLNLMKGQKNRLSELKKTENRIQHFYQSVYAQQFLYKNGITKVLPLRDYINTELCEPIPENERENIVLYNPAKGYRFSKRIIADNPDIRFIALKGLSRDELKSLMRKAKVYMDFGHFPGKDRLPREAVMNGLCIITGKNGAAFFYEDVAIDNEYKFSTKGKNIKAISCKIHDILTNFNNHSKKFDVYRRRIAKEQKEFFEDIESYFFVD